MALWFEVLLFDSFAELLMPAGEMAPGSKDPEGQFASRVCDEPVQSTRVHRKLPEPGGAVALSCLQS